jgi:hypothetical protein
LDNFLHEAEPSEDERRDPLLSVCEAARPASYPPPPATRRQAAAERVTGSPGTRDWEHCCPAADAPGN